MRLLAYLGRQLSDEMDRNQYATKLFAFAYMFLFYEIVFEES